MLSNRKPGLCDSLWTELDGGLGHLLSGHLRGSAVPQMQAGGGPLRGSARFPGSLALMAVCSAGGAPACLLHALKLGVVVPPTAPSWGRGPGLFVLFPPRCSQALCSGHLQCSTSALALGRGRGGLGCSSACCVHRARGPSLSRATVVRTLGDPAWFGRLLSMEDGQMAEAARSLICVVPGSWSGGPALQGV